MNKRILSFLIDYLIVMTLFVSLSFWTITQEAHVILKVMYTIALLLSTSVLIMKDIDNGQSLGKKIMRIKVVDLNNHVPSKFKLILRNITICIWPIEFLLILSNKQKLGDRLANTKIIDC